MFVSINEITATNSSQLRMWQANFELNVKKSLFDLGCLSSEIIKISENKVIIINKWPDKDSIQKVLDIYKQNLKEEQLTLKMERKIGEIVFHEINVNK